MRLIITRHEISAMGLRDKLQVFDESLRMPESQSDLTAPLSHFTLLWKNAGVKKREGRKPLPAFSLVQINQAANGTASDFLRYSTSVAIRPQTAAKLIHRPGAALS